MKSGKLRSGLVSVQITGAEPERTLYALNRAGIQMYYLCWTDTLTVRFLCSRNNCKRILAMCESNGDRVTFGRDAGDGFWRKKVLSRPVLAAGVIILLVLTVIIPTRVLFFRVEGNDRVPARLILEEAEGCGIRFGMSRRAVRSERMKNALLESLPDLKWAGINTVGCTAVISVREREVEQNQDSAGGFSGIVAAVDGYITSTTVLKGTSLCAPGEIVKKGQLLISGYADHGICIQATGAEGEIFAQTVRKTEAVVPLKCLDREMKGEKVRRLSLIIGKKRINLWKDSRIWDATCGRMYEEYYLTLPGGFRLPIALAVDTFLHGKTVESQWPELELETALKAHARNTVLEQTIAGSILREEHTVTQNQQVCAISSRFQCSEMIGRVITEEIGDTHGKTD